MSYRGSDYAHATFAGTTLSSDTVMESRFLHQGPTLCETGCVSCMNHRPTSSDDSSVHYLPGGLQNNVVPGDSQQRYHLHHPPANSCHGPPGPSLDNFAPRFLTYNGGSNIGSNTHLDYQDPYDANHTFELGPSIGPLLGIECSTSSDSDINNLSFTSLAPTSSDYGSAHSLSGDLQNDVLLDDSQQADHPYHTSAGSCHGPSGSSFDNFTPKFLTHDGSSNLGSDTQVPYQGQYGMNHMFELRPSTEPRGGIVQGSTSSVSNTIGLSFTGLAPTSSDDSLVHSGGLQNNVIPGDSQQGYHPYHTSANTYHGLSGSSSDNFMPMFPPTYDGGSNIGGNTQVPYQDLYHADRTFEFGPFNEPLGGIAPGSTSRFSLSNTSSPSFTALALTSPDYRMAQGLQNDAVPGGSQQANHPSADPYYEPSDLSFDKFMSRFPQMYDDGSNTGSNTRVPYQDLYDAEHTLQLGPSIEPLGGIAQSSTSSSSNATAGLDSNVPSFMGRGPASANHSSIHEVPGGPRHNTRTILGGSKLVTGSMTDDYISAQELCANKRSGVCKLMNGNCPCDKRIKLNRRDITRHLSLCHPKPRGSGNLKVRCRWENCHAERRGDILYRHIVEKHFHIKRGEN